jgi:hypothetical protein
MATNSRFLKDFTAAANEAAARYAEQADSQARARNLLRPDEVAGDYDANRLLFTTLGGQLRPLTHDDLRTFKAQADALGKKFKGGITAKQIIDRSLKVDRDRSNTEIRVALPRQYGGGKMHIVTNAGPNSEVRTHNVLVEFLDLPSAVASPSKPADAARVVTMGKVRCACDCGRWTYWFSYIATIGKFNAGNPQPNFPKIRNPMLVGVACKHVLRVMQGLQGPMVRAGVEKMVIQGRRNEAPKVTAVTRKDAKALAEHQLKTADWKRNQIETTAEKRTRLAAQRRVKDILQKAKAPLVKPTPAKLDLAKRKFEQQARQLAQLGVISQKMLADMLAKLKGRK